jgi:ATP-dependent DNA helicase RecG
MVLKTRFGKKSRGESKKHKLYQIVNLLPHVEVVSSSLLKSGGPALFQRSHRIEKWGRGIKMILEREPRTEFEEVGTALFVARFWRKELEKIISETTGVPSEETSEETSDKILAIIRSDMKTTARHIAGVLGLSSRAIEMQLAKLKQNGRLKRVGAKKGGHWEVNGDGD